jgi:hypothetical protein
MAIKELTAQAMELLVGTRHASTGFEFPANGLQPYYEWLIRALYLLGESSAGALRVAEDDVNATTVWIAPGRASIAAVTLAYGGGTLELGSYNNDTAYVWLYDDAGNAAIGIGAAAGGWPAGNHIKLAEVTLSSGAITEILDRRFETIFRV